MMAAGTPGAIGSQRSDTQDKRKPTVLDDEVAADIPDLILYNYTKPRAIALCPGSENNTLYHNEEDFGNLDAMSWAGQSRKTH